MPPPRKGCSERELDAFTLAEVLITLGIIGVVAALTIPTLISNHRKKEVVTKLEKIYTIMNQAINMSNAEYGDVESWIKDCGPSTAPTCTTEEIKTWFNQYIGKHLQILKIENNEQNTGIIVYLNDGSILTIPNYIYDIGFYINVKSLRQTKTGINQFSFRFNPIRVTGQSSGNDYTIVKTFEPYTWSWDGTREGLTTESNQYACNKRDDSHDAFCAKLIQYEGWQIPEDYPYKF